MYLNKKSFSFIILLPLLLTGFVLLPTGNKPVGVDTSSMEKNIKAADDFYRFANGTWLKKNPVPDSESEWGAFNELQEQNNALLRKIIEEAAASPLPAGSIRQKVGDFYAIAMDTARLERQGLRPLVPYIKMVDSVQQTADIMRTAAFFHANGIASLFGFYVTQDQKKSDEHICYFFQDGLGLPDRDYYLKDDDDSKRIREAYTEHIGKMFRLAGKGDLAAAAPGIIMTLETELATSSMTRVELRDEEKQYNKMTYEELLARYPDMNWNAYIEGLAINSPKSLIVSQPEFFAKLNSLLKKTGVQEWRTYLLWCLINESADKLNTPLEKQNFSFYGTVLSGAKEMRPRWKRMVSATNAGLGEAVGQLYVEKAFSAESKKRVNEMVDNLMAVYKDRIKGLDWMSEQTKEKALVKLASFTRKLGYPDKWKDYSPLTVTRESYLKNSMQARHFAFKRMINKLGKPVDKTEWGMSPQTVNAYYNPSKNEIVFPAAIMQPPFFNAQADDAVNYGAIGAVIGHEITHGFDDQGSRYDENGNMLDWWTADDRQKFETRTKKLVEQFNGYQAMEDLKVNGELTLGENIADLGGLTMAFLAYQRSLEGKPRETIDGFTPEQRFFIGWAQVWRNNYRPESLRRQVLTNVHAPDHYRAIGAPSNLPEFYAAFQVKPGNKMYREENIRVKVW